MLAPSLKLDRLIAVVDFNKWQATDRSEEVMALGPLANERRVVAMSKIVAEARERVARAPVNKVFNWGRLWKLGLLTVALLLGTPGLALAAPPAVFIPVGTPGLDHSARLIRVDNVVSLPLKDLGRAKKIQITKDDTTIVDGVGEKDAIEAAAKEAESE